MRFLVDEHIDFRLVSALRKAGFQVVSIAEISPRATDKEIITLALQQESVLITADKDFGELVYATKAKSSGVLLLRYNYPQRKTMLVGDVLNFIEQYGQDLLGSFAVLRPGRVKISKLPDFSDFDNSPDWSVSPSKGKK